MLATAAAGQTVSDPKPLSDVRQFLSWLPSDTETMIVARDFSLPDLVAIEKKEKGYTQEALFARLALGPWGINRSLSDYLKNRRILLAVEGSRKFRSPKSFGLMLFEGCSIIMFADQLSDRPEQVFKALSGAALRVEEIEGRSILVFEDKSEQDTWTTYVAFAGSDVLLVVTNMDYLREVLSKVRGRNGPRALPETLPEWVMSIPAPAFGGCAISTGPGATATHHRHSGTPRNLLCRRGRTSRRLV